MHPLIIFIKSYKPDFHNLKTLLQSIERFNMDKIPVVISLNDEDFFDLEREYHHRYKIYKDSQIVSTKITEGWRYQQIIKSNVYRLKICENYVSIDSDSVFIKNFFFSDFMFDHETPYTVMHESKGFQEIAERIGMDSNQLFFKKSLRDTRPFFGNTGKEWDYGPSPYIWSCRVWEHFNANYLKNLNQSFDDFFEAIDQKNFSPSECTIYGEYLLKTKIINIIAIEALFKVYHYEKQYQMEKKMSDEKLKKIYIGIIYQSNWKKTRKKWFFK